MKKTWDQLTQEYDEALEKGGLLSGRQTIALLSALPKETQKQLFGGTIIPAKGKGKQHNGNTTTEKENAGN